MEIQKMFKTNRNKLAVGSVATLVAGGASAAVDTAVTAAITGAGADVAIIGGAVLIVMVGIKVFKWARAAL
jgi:hypothetical protein